MSAVENFDKETPFIQLVDFIKAFNKENPSKIQPITDDILSMLNDLGGLGLWIARKDSGLMNYQEYNDDLTKLTDLLNSEYIKGMDINFGKDVFKIKSKLLHAQIQSILREHLEGIWPKSESSKRGVGHPKSRWKRSYMQGKPIIEKLCAVGITNDFLAHFFGVKLDTFERKIPK
jgi:hypothetical protein